MFNSTKMIDLLNKKITEICIFNKNNPHIKHLEVKKNFF